MTAFTVGTSAVPAANAVLEKSILGGEAITICQTVVLSETTGRWVLSDADALATASGKAGLAITAGATGAPMIVQTEGDVTLSGATGTAGNPAYLHTTAGAIGPFADLATGDFLCYFGGWKTDKILSIHPHPLGVAQ